MDLKETIDFQKYMTENYFYHDNNPFKLNLGMSAKFYDFNNTGDRLLISI